MLFCGVGIRVGTNRIKLIGNLPRSPIFSAAIDCVLYEMSKERQIIIEEIKSYDDDPEEFIFDLADSIVFPNNTLGNSIDGTIESLKKIDTDTLYNFHSLHYNPQNIIISLSGNIPHDQLVREVEKYFKNSIPQANTISRTKPTFETKDITIEKPIQQAHQIFGKQTSSGNSSERFSASLLNIIFGDGLSSRIYQNLREKMGLAYSVFSSINYYTDCGVLYLYIATDKNNLQKSEDSLMNELNRLHSFKITKSEIQRAKEQMKTARILEFESMSTRMQSLIKNEIMLGEYESIEDITAKIDSVTLDDLYSIAEQYYTTDNWCRIQLYPTE